MTRGPAKPMRAFGSAMFTSPSIAYEAVTPPVVGFVMIDVDPLSRPYYFLADGGLNGAMIDAITAAGVQARVRGTIPGTAADNSLFVNFKADYTARFPDVLVDGKPETFGAAGGYDSVYLLAYSAIAAKANPLTGEQLARGLPLMADTANGNVILAGPLAFGDASNDLQGGVGINYQQRDKIILAPIRLGVGLRAGASIGYMHYTRAKTLNPF